MDSAEFEDVAEELAPVSIEGNLAKVASANNMSEAEYRIDLALHFRSFLGDGDVFESDSPAAAQVSEELRTFAQSRLEVLLGMRAERSRSIATEVFSDEQIVALRALADGILKKGADKILAPPPVKRTPVPMQSSAIQIPQPRRHIVRTTNKKPPPVTPTAQSVVEPAPVKPTATKRKGPLKTADTAEDGEIFAENGQKYVWARNDEGGRYKKCVSGQIRNPNAVPMPDGAAMSAMTLQHAVEAEQVSKRRMNAEVSNPKTDDETTAMVHGR